MGEKERSYGNVNVTCEDKNKQNVIKRKNCSKYSYRYVTTMAQKWSLSFDRSTIK